jgi:sulfite reductase (NADPH) hemoprotein beta-component
MPLLDSKTAGPARLGFADEKDLDAFVDKLDQFERGDLSPEAWKQFRLVNGVYSQRQEGDAMMVRVKIPQGLLTADQLRALGEVAQRFSTGRGHITTRQNVQFHFVKLDDTSAVVAALGAAGLTTREACGNSVRNVTTCPFAGVSALEPFDVTPYAELVTRRLLRGPLSASLPRKFKIAFGGCCGTDCVGASFNDIGLLARWKDGRPGFRVTLAGGLSTLRRAGILAHEFAPAEEVLEIAEAVVRVFNRTGNRKRRDKARLKFVVEQMGVEAFLAEYFKERELIREELGPRASGIGPRAGNYEGGLPLPTTLPRNGDDELVLPATPPRVVAHPRPRAVRPGLDEWKASNVRAQKDPDYAAVTVRVLLGDLTAAQFRELAAIAEEFSEEREVRTTVDQNLVLRSVARAHLPALHAALDAIGLSQPGAGTVSDVVSCPGAFSCRLAVTQSRGMARELSTALHDAQVPGLHIKISGCPNGCGQHYVAGIGLQGSVRKLDGRAVPQYHLYLGGGFGAEAATFGRLAAKLPARRVPEAVKRLIALYTAEKAPGEAPEVFLARLAPARVSALLADLEALTSADATESDFVDLDEEKQFQVQLSEGECAS